MMEETLFKVRNLQDAVSHINDPQVERYLLRHIFNICRVTHLLRTVPGVIVRDKFWKFDSMMSSSLVRLLGNHVMTGDISEPLA